MSGNTTTGNFQIQVSDGPNGAIIIALLGVADMLSTDLLDRQIMLISVKRPQNVVFDLSQLTFISSISMGALVRMRNAANRWGGTVSLAAVNEAVLGAFKRARLDMVFPIHPTIEAATQST